MRWNPLLFRWHRWMGYVVALQVLAWVLGGLLFSWLPFQAWVKGGDVLIPPQPSWPTGPELALGPLPTDKGSLLGLQSVATAAGPAVKLKYEQGEVLLSATGGLLPPADAAAVAAFARTLYKGSGRPLDVRRLEEAPRRLGIVDELGGKRDVWLAEFDDAFRSRFYFDGASGEFLAVRNEAWVIYDFFWRLHVMDYRGGEDFNNKLLRTASAFAILLTCSGLALSVLALRRAWRRRAAGR